MNFLIKYGKPIGIVLIVVGIALLASCAKNYYYYPQAGSTINNQYSR